MRNHLYIIRLIAALSIVSMTACAELEPEVTPSKVTDGGPAVVYASIGTIETPVTRVTKNTYDQWSTVTFNQGDVTGLYAVKGRRDDQNTEDYDNPIQNGMMFYEGGSSNSYRFSNSDIVISPSVVSSNYSIMYHPYYEDMPDPEDDTTQTGLVLRKNDNGIEKCVDFMQTSIRYSTTSTSSTTSPQLPLSNGLLKPSFYHYMSQLVIQRGEGFKGARDERIWVVLKDPFTDIRIRRSTGAYSYSLQNTLESENISLPSVSSVDKYRVWETWEGNIYSNGEKSNYVILPPREVSYILIQDRNGVWQKVTDFYLGTETDLTSKIPTGNNRYVVNISLQGLDVVVRPVIIEEWRDPVVITDQRDAGINSMAEFNSWLALYNSYTEDRNRANEEQLSDYGDASVNTVTGETTWTFYINVDLDFKDYPDSKIIRLDDTLMGSSVYLNYTISNLNHPWIGQMGEKGALKALDFRDLYIVDTGGNESSTGGLVREINGGKIENCNIYNGIIVSDKPAGMISGTIENCEVKNCVISGQTIGTSTASSPYSGLFGSDPVNSVINEVNSSELYFETYN